MAEYSQLRDLVTTIVQQYGSGTDAERDLAVGVIASLLEQEQKACQEEVRKLKKNLTLLEAILARLRGERIEKTRKEDFK